MAYSGLGRVMDVGVCAGAVCVHEGQGGGVGEHGGT